jgi:hypothetical protein
MQRTFRRERRANARPIPLAPPVTTPTLPLTPIVFRPPIE